MSRLARPARARRGVARVRVAVPEEEPGVGFKGLPDCPADDHAADLLVARRDRLGEGDQVGYDVEVLGGEPRAEAAEAGDHLVEHQQRPVTVAQGAGLAEVAVGGGNTPPAPCTGSVMTAATSVGVVGHHDGEGFDVVARHLHHVGHERTPALAVRADALRARPAEVGAVVAALAADDQRPLRGGRRGAGPGATA